jgi:multiple sugar transport system substrate-binding protein
MRESRFKWNIAPMPVGRKGVEPLVSYLHNGGYAIAKSTKHPKEAWLLLKALVSAKTQTSIAGSLGTFPSRKSVVATGAYLKGAPSNFRVIPDMLEKGRLFPFTPTYVQEGRVITTQGELLLNGKLTAQEATQRACEEIDNLLGGRK